MLTLAKEDFRGRSQLSFGLLPTWAIAMVHKHFIYSDSEKCKLQ